MSTMEKAKNKMKNIRKTRSMNKNKYALLSASEKERLWNERNKKTIKEEVDIALYDYYHNQYPATKYPYLREILNKRLIELKDIISINPEAQREKEIIKKIEVVLNDIR